MVSLWTRVKFVSRGQLPFLTRSLLPPFTAKHFERVAHCPMSLSFPLTTQPSASNHHRWTEGTNQGHHQTPCCSTQCVLFSSYLTWPLATFDHLEPLPALQTLSSLDSHPNSLLVGLPPLCFFHCSELCELLSYMPAFKVGGPLSSFFVRSQALSSWFYRLLKLPLGPSTTIYLPQIPQIKAHFWFELQVYRWTAFNANAQCM